MLDRRLKPVTGRSPAEQARADTRLVDDPTTPHHATPPDHLMRGRFESESATEAHFRAYLEAAPNAIIMTESDGRIVLVNHEVEVLFGYHRDALVGQHIEILIPERYRSAHLQHRHDYIAAPRTRPMGTGLELFGRRQDGSEFPVEISLSATPVAGGLLVTSIVRDFTEHKESESRLRVALDAAQAAASQFRELLETAPDAMVLASSDGIITLINRQTEILFGYARQELIGQPLEILIPERFHMQHVHHRLGYASQPRTRPMGTELELFGQRNDGTEFPVEVSLSALQSPDGMQLLAAIRDMSERKRMERALRQAEQEAKVRASQLDTTIETMADGVIIYDREARIVRLNAAAQAIFALAVPPEYMGVPFSERVAHLQLRDDHGRLLLASEWPPTRMLRGEVLHGANAADIEVPTMHGNTLYFNVSGAPMRNAGGEITGAVAIMRDVTERRRAERQEREEVEAGLAVLQTVIDEMPSGVILARGLQARLVLANQAAAEVLGAEWSRGQAMADFLATSGTRVFGTDGRSLAIEQLATVRALQHGEAVRQHQEIIRHADGTTLPILLNAVVLDPRVLRARAAEDTAYDHEPLEPVALVVLQDVSPLKDAERLKDEFIGIAAHELRNPMAALKGFAEMLVVQTARGKGSPLDEWQIEAIEAIDQATTRLVALTDDLLDVTRLQGGLLDLRVEPSDLGALTRRTVGRLQITSDSHTITVHAAPDLIIVPMDVQRIEQVIANLTSNAIKYSPRGGNIAITVGKASAEGMAQISVRDHGIGIPADQKAQIFGRFVRANNARALGISGTGLGLYLCRELVERHGGRIWFKSREGHGATFTFTLPLAMDLEPR